MDPFHRSPGDRDGGSGGFGRIAIKYCRNLSGRTVPEAHTQTVPCAPAGLISIAVHRSSTSAIGAPRHLDPFRRRCGKAACRCATGDPHESPALVYTETGRSKTLTLRPGEVAEVTAALARYETARTELETAAQAGLAVLAGRRPQRSQSGS
jgi:hypothetical protein